MDALLALDYSIFEWIHHQGQTDWLDAIMPLWRDKYTWIPAYICLLGFFIWRYKWQTVGIVLGLVLVVGLADTASSQWIKKSVQRLRPCNDPEVITRTADLVHCGSGYSFTSSHATNHFAVAVFLILLLRRRYRSKALVIGLLFWAASIAYGQVYVGVHYPLDVSVGALLGMSIGWLVATLHQRAHTRYQLKWI